MMRAISLAEAAHRPAADKKSRVTRMPVVKVADIAYGRLRSPDLDVMEEFLTRFGLVKSDRTSTALYMRGTDPPHHIHVTEKGEPRFVGLAYHANSEDDLHKLAKVPGASGVELIDEPGGGKRVRLKEPNGYQVEVVHGIATLPAIPVPRQKLNSGESPLLRRRRTDAAAERPRACEADRPRRDDDAEIPRDRARGSATPWASSARMTFMPARRRT